MLCRKIEIVNVFCLQTEKLKLGRSYFISVIFVVTSSSSNNRYYIEVKTDHK